MHTVIDRVPLEGCYLLFGQRLIQSFLNELKGA